MTTAFMETARLRIEPFAERHLGERYVQWLNDAEVVRYSDQRHRRHTLELCRAYWQSFVGTPNHFWAIVARDAKLGHVGNITAHVEPAHSVADVGILIGERKVWGQGYGVEAWTAVCDHLFRVHALRKITAGTIEPNRGMLEIMRKVGMVEEGRRVRHQLWEGREVDVILAALFRETWLASHGT